MDSSVYIPILAAVVSGGLSYSAANIVHKFNKTFKRKEKALTMANEFSNLISKRSFDIGEINKEILEKIGMQDKIKTLEQERYLDFDYDELNTFFTKEELNKYYDYKSSTNVSFLKILYKTFRNGTLREECIKATIINFDDEISLKENLKKDVWVYTSGEKEIKIKANDIFQSVNTMWKKYNDTVLDTLNKLEWFAMHFTNNIAESNTVYQSLHQLYLKTIISHYIDISNKNKTGHEKYYVNLIDLYNSWNKTKLKFKKKSDKLKKAKKRTYQRTKKLK
ncbi:hypothetical protein [Staphylococcus haemolyticus]|uniref:hypothetical protein n=1 Tax=Staphylococcus haemolyticus TaxID=1283 RepID=UPI00069FD492|nr:hypothetical protein [Staphylococcus haemolyticus]